MTYPTIRPELTLDFANSRQLDPRITFSRSSGATYLNPDTGLITLASDHEARFEKEGLLIEESRTNLLTYSEEFDQWDKGNNTTITPNAAIAPDGSMTADRAEFPVASMTYIKQNSLIVAGTTYTGSVWAKAVTPGTNAQFALHYGNGAGEVVSFFTATGEWQRFTSTASPTGSGNFHINNFGDSFASDIYIWGAQLEQGDFVTSLIPTSASSVTRSADIAQVPSSIMDSLQSNVANSCYITTHWTTWGANKLEFFASGQLSVAQWRTNKIRSSSMGIASTGYTPIPGEENFNTVFAAADSTSKVIGNNAGALSTVNSGQNVTSANLVFGEFSNSQKKQTIARIVWYSRRLTDSELQSITL